MKVKNEFIKIKMGKKSITLQNLILDNYLKAVKNIQFTTNTTPTDIKFELVSFMLNNEIYISPEQEYRQSDFYFSQGGGKKEVSYVGGTAVVDYYYNINRNEIIDYLGAKITAIAFAYSNNGYKYGAIVDTSNYDLYIVEDSELQITIRDICQTDGFYYSNENVNAILHMFPDRHEYFTPNTQSYEVIRWGVLKSVGLGVSINNIDEEYDISDYEEELTDTEFGYEINRILNIEHANEGLFPDLDLYPALDLYPERVIREPLYPSNDIYPSIELYPREVPYQYAQLKYQVYEYTNDPYSENPEIHALNKYYIISNLINSKLYKIKEKVKYERATS